MRAVQDVHRISCRRGALPLAGLILTGLLTGCVTSTVNTTGQLPEVVEAGESGNTQPATPDAGATPPSESYATLALLDQSAQLRREGNIPAAISTVERAIRLEPHNAKLWLELAQLQLGAGQEAQAEQLARKSIALVRNDPDTERAAWLTLADIREATGDTDLADELRRRWRTGSG